MNHTDPHDLAATERRLTAALAAAASAVDVDPEPRPSTRPVEPAAPRLLRTRRGVAALAATAVVSGVAGAAAAAIPGGETSTGDPGAAQPSATATQGLGRPGPRQIDIDGDGVDDPVVLNGRVLSVELSRSGEVDRTRLTGGGRVLALHRSDDEAVAVVGGAGSRYLGLVTMDRRGFRSPGLTTLETLSVAATRSKGKRLRITVE